MNLLETTIQRVLALLRGATYVVNEDNTPFKTLQVDANGNAITAANPLPVSAVIASGSGTDTPSITIHNSGQTIAAGARIVSIMTDSSFAGTILGTTVGADMIYTFNASLGRTLAAITVTQTAGTFTVIKIV